MCVVQCVSQKKGFADKDGNLKIDEVKTKVKEILSKEPWLAPKVDGIIKKCIEESTVAPTAATPAAKDSNSCNPAGIKLARCLFRETQLACPADQIKDEKVCNKLKDRLTKTEDIGSFASLAAAAADDIDN